MASERGRGQLVPLLRTRHAHVCPSSTTTPLAPNPTSQSPYSTPHCVPGRCPGILSCHHPASPPGAGDPAPLPAPPTVGSLATHHQAPAGLGLQGDSTPPGTCPVCLNLDQRQTWTSGTRDRPRPGTDPDHRPTRTRDRPGP